MPTSSDRSFARAVEEFLRRHESQALLDTLNRAYEDFQTPEEKKLLRNMGRKQRELVKGEW